MSGIAIAGSGGSGSIVIGTTTIGGGTDTCILFDKAGVFGEDTNLEWDYTNKALNITGATVTANHPVLQLSQTWNNAAVAFNGFEFDLTNTASSTSSNLFNFTLGGTPVLYFNISGPIGGNGNLTYFLGVGAGSNDPFFAGYSIGGIHGIEFGGDTFVGFLAAGKADFSKPGFLIRSDGLLGWISSSFGSTPFTNTALQQEGAGILALLQPRNLTNPAVFRVYNTTDTVGGAPTNYERAVFDWTTTSNVLTIGTQKGGSGTLRNLSINPAGSLVCIGGTSFTDANGNVVLTVTGPSNEDIVSITDGTLAWGFYVLNNAGTRSGLIGTTTNHSFGFFQGNSNVSVALNGSQDLTFTSPLVLRWTNSGSNPFLSGDTGIARVAATVVEINNGTAGTGPGVILPRPTTFANLPASPTQGMMASITDGLAGNCADGSCTTFGTNVTGGTGALKLNLWYNGTHWTLIGK